ncbi:unnamed protein product, partial [Choristocarpus tenellus]
MDASRQIVQSRDFLFLDVEWLSQVLKPILDHKLGGIPFESAEMETGRYDLVERGILRRNFALHLWSPFMKMEEHIHDREAMIRGLFDVLIKLGIVLPTQWGPESDKRASTAQKVSNMLVIMRLPTKCPETVRDKLRRFEEALGDNKVAIQWHFDSAGSPYGMVERLIAFCHVLGEVWESGCWRYGVLLTGDSHAVLVKYDGDRHLLTVTVFGLKVDLLMWGVLRFVASAVLRLSKDWSGVLWSASLQCPNH